MYYFQAFDDKFLKPLLLRDHKVEDPKLMETFLSIQENDAKEYIKRQMTIQSDKSDKSTIDNINGIPKSSNSKTYKT